MLVPRVPRQRLESLSRPDPNLPRLKLKRKVPPQTPKCCDTPDIKDEDGMKICLSCGTQIADANIVADVTFEEDSRGAATVQGGFIGENARHARTLGSGIFRQVGGSERNTQADVEANARRVLSSLCPRLGITDDISMQAQNLFGMAARMNFNSGRRTDEVVAACLFAACRKNPKNHVLLMDIAEILKVNVFRLGEVYKDFCNAAHYHQENIPIQQLVDVEPLIQRYCKKLEFGNKTRLVAEDAIKILKRMNRDWMVTGRHPAGLCGACIILAARMNNFRRSVREVVYVAKIADMTIAKRIEEFRRTKASTLSVEQFRESGWRMKSQADPPAISNSKLQKKKFEEKKRQRQLEYHARLTAERESVIREADGQDANEDPVAVLDAENTADSRTPTPSSQQGGANQDDDSSRKRRRINDSSQAPRLTQQEPRYDADGFAIPALPMHLDPALGGDSLVPEESPLKRKRGRPKKARPPTVQMSEEEIMTEQEIERAIEQTIEDEDFQTALEKARRDREETPHEPDETEADNDNVDRQHNDQHSELPQSEATEVSSEPAPSRVLVTDVELEAEFANDPEVMNCLLSSEEQKIKEQIWVAHNEDWLRAQYEKQLLKDIAASTGGGKKKRDSGKGGKRKKRGRIGDRSVLEQAETPIETPADAAHAMLKQRAGPQFSKFVDYERLKRVYGVERTPSTSISGSRASSVAPSINGPSRESSATPSAREGAEVSAATGRQQGRSVTFGLRSPQATQQAEPGVIDTAISSPSRTHRRGQQPSPPPTQAKAGAEEDEEGQAEQEGEGAEEPDYEDDQDDEEGHGATWADGDFYDEDADGGEDDDFDDVVARNTGEASYRRYAEESYADDEFV